MTLSFNNPAFGVRVKVLLPMIIALVVVLALVMTVASRSIEEQLDRNMSRRLGTSEAVFKNSQAIRAKNLLLRYRNIPNEPRFKAVFQQADPNTLRFSLGEMLEDLPVDAIAYVNNFGEWVESASRGVALNPPQWRDAMDELVQRALAGQANADVARVGNNIFDFVAVPVIIGGGVQGAVLFADELGDAAVREISQLTDCGIVLVADNRVSASTLSSRVTKEDLISLYHSMKGVTDGHAFRSVLEGDHYLALGGMLGTANRPADMGYMLLSSYEEDLRTLHDTRKNLVLVVLLGTLLGTLTVWFLVRKAINPLSQLRDSAEAVGRGDFSKRVPVLTRDEVGDLAHVFNRMTENLQISRRELEKTVVELKRTQERLIQSEKLSAIGEFVAGVTHELNNPLTSVLGYAELLMHAAKDDDQKRDAQAIVTGALRCQKIVQNLLSFARQHKPEKKRANVNSLIEGVLEFMQYDLKSGNITIVKRLDPRLPPALVDPHQIQQVFVNIIQNARQAMESARPDGVLTITTGVHGEFLRVTFSDNGPGVAPENQTRIFDPFFTTKPVGTGTGLGMSLSYGIVKEHGGTIAVDSAPGSGATFIVELPASTQAAEAPRRREAAGTVFDQEGHGHTVLVVDDESSIIELASKVLEGAGYSVDAVESGEAAIQRILHQRYDLIICDLKMPGISGRQVFERVVSFDPESASRFLFTTGDVMNMEHQKFFKQHDLPCLPKPFSIEELRAVVHRRVPG